MKAFHKHSVYDCFFTKEEAERGIEGARLETDLTDQYGCSTGKRIVCVFVDPEFGDAQLDLEPRDACWEDATRFTITARRRYLQNALRDYLASGEGHSNARLGSSGDVYFHLDNERAD